MINPPLGRKLRMALIGGAGNAFIGPVHATAAQLDHRAELVAGALSSDAEKSRAAAPAMGIAAERSYGSYSELLAAEAALPEDQRIDFVTIATPNDTHFEIARTALQAGFDVVCDKPLTIARDEAEHLARLVSETGQVFALTHNYSGYPMVRQARQMVEAGELGQVQAVRVNYIQGFLCGLKPGEVPARGVWKSDPEKAGSGTLGDIGTHAYQLACYVTGWQPTELSSVIKTFHAERKLEDYGHALIRCREAIGMITFSQITHGRLNDLTLEVDGQDASLVWRQEEPNQLVVRRFGEPAQVFDRNPRAAYTHDLSRAASRLPAAHPEGFFEAFANIYQGVFDHIVANRSGQQFVCDGSKYPTVQDGVAGIKFVQACQASSAADGIWMEL